MPKYRIRATRTKKETIENVITANSKKEAITKMKRNENRFSNTSHVLESKDEKLIEIGVLSVNEDNSPMTIPSY